MATWMEYQTKLNEKYMSILHCIPSFEEGTSDRKLEVQLLVFVCFCFTSSFKSADIIFYNFLELNLKLSERKIFVMNLSFSTDSPKLT